MSKQILISFFFQYLKESQTNVARFNNNNINIPNHEDQVLMPYQSSAIQEKLKRFEPTASINEVSKIKAQVFQNEQQHIVKGLGEENRVFKLRNFFSCKIKNKKKIS